MDLAIGFSISELGVNFGAIPVKIKQGLAVFYQTKTVLPLRLPLL
jgi:hypothetical protein